MLENRAQDWTRSNNTLRMRKPIKRVFIATQGWNKILGKNSMGGGLFFLVSAVVSIEPSISFDSTTSSQQIASDAYLTRSDNLHLFKKTV